MKTAKLNVAERRFADAVEHARKLKAKSREAKQRLKQAKKDARQAAKAARAARKEADKARRGYKKAAARAGRKQSKAAKVAKGARENAPITTPRKASSRAGEMAASPHRRRRSLQGSRRRIGDVGEDAVDAESAKPPELGADVTAVEG